MKAYYSELVQALAVCMHLEIVENHHNPFEVADLFDVAPGHVFDLLLRSGLLPPDLADTVRPQLSLT